VSTPEEQPQKRTPFSAKLPQTTIDAVVPVVKRLADFGTGATPHRIAQLTGTTPASSSFKTKLAAAGYYGLIAKEGELRTLTERGESIASEDANRVLSAKREAVMSTTFGSLLYEFRGRAVDENIFSARLQSDFDVPANSATGVAKTLVETATQAELINQSDQFDVAAIEEFASLRPQTPPSSSNSRTTTKPGASAAPETPAAPSKPPEKPTVVESTTLEEPPPFNPSVQVVVKIDATALAPKQIAELIRELQKPTTT